MARVRRLSESELFDRLSRIREAFPISPGLLQPRLPLSLEEFAQGGISPFITARTAAAQAPESIQAIQQFLAGIGGGAPLGTAPVAPVTPLAGGPVLPPAGTAPLPAPIPAPPAGGLPAGQDIPGVFTGELAPLGILAGGDGTLADQLATGLQALGGGGITRRREINDILARIGVIGDRRTGPGAQETFNKALAGGADLATRLRNAGGVSAGEIDLLSGLSQAEQETIARRGRLI